MNIIEVFEQAKYLQKKDFAVLGNEEKISYKDLLSSTSNLSHLFTSLNLKQTDKILISTQDKRSLVEITVAAYRFGLALVLVDFNSKQDRANSILMSCEPAAIFVDPNLIEEWQLTNPNTIGIKRELAGKKKVFQKLFSKTNNLEVSNDNSKFYPACLNAFEGKSANYPAFIDPSSIAYIMYTSGSTSDPKGVAISYHNLFTHLETLKKVYQMNQETNILNLLNLFHADGINQGPLLSLYCGATWFSPFKLDTAQLDLIYFGIYKYRISHLFVVPTLLAFFEKYHTGFEDSFQTHDFKFMISVAAQLEPRLWQSLTHIFKVQIVNVYGLTETVSGGIFCGPNLDSHRIGTIGKPVDCELKIVDEEGQLLAVGEKGELLMKGEHVMLGYFNNPEANKEVLMDGWLHTGDIAQEDEDGFFRIVGRKKSMINSGGFRVQPEEIEEVLLKMPEVDECKVLGISDPILTEKLIAFVKPKSHQNLSELIYFKFMRLHLEQEKVPHEVYFVEEFQKGLSGKIQADPLKNLVFEIYQKAKVKGVSNMDTLFQIAAKVFKINIEEINEFSSSTNLTGWDSLNNFILITTIEDTFKIEFSTAEIMSMKSIISIDKLISRKLNNE